MKIRDILINHLSPSQMRIIKKPVMYFRYLKSLLKRNNNTLSINENAVSEYCVLSMPKKHVFFGYYDLQQFDDNYQKMLVHVVDEKKCNPEKDEASIYCVDKDSKEFNYVTSTKAWSWQQGSRLRWHPIKKNTIVYNDVVDGKYVAVEYNIVEKAVIAQHPMAFYDMSSDAMYGLGLNFSRLQRLRPGYGYSVLPDESVGIPASEDDGIFRYDFNTGEIKLLISLSKLAKEVDIGEDVEHYINHISISPNGDKFMFFHLWSSVKKSSWDMRLYVADIKTGEYTCLEKEHIVSHYCWKDNDTLLVTTAAMNGKKTMYIEYGISEGIVTVHEGEWLKRDGHPSYINGTDNYISDTYPQQSLQYVFKQTGSYSDIIAKAFADPRLFDEKRCDLHPRITPDNEYITFDTTYKNKVRQVVMMKIRQGYFDESQESFTIVGLGYQNNIIKEMFYEIINHNVPNAEYLEPFVYPNKLIKLFHKVVYVRKFRKFFGWLPADLFEKYHILNKKEFDKNKTNYVIMNYGTDLDRLHFSEILENVRKKYNGSVKFVLMLFDPIISPLNNQGWERITQVVNEFDIVTTFDEQDASQYSMLHFTDPYAKRNVIPDDNIQKCDVFFIGADKGRGKLLNEIQKLFLNNNINSNLRVVGLPSELEMEGLYCQKEYMCYEQTIKNVLNSNCLLEVLCEGQHSSSLRYYEAVVYNKKLLTNNANIVNMSYYNPDYIKVFQKVSDIDVNWIKDGRDVDYNYGGDFSITHFFDMIKKYDNNSNK